MKLGDIELISIVENRFRLDAGSLFGVIPKVIWSKMVTADELNRVELDINPLIIKAGGQLLVVDTGFGDTPDEKAVKIYGIESETRWPEQLEKNNIEPESVTGVIFTHLHADHALGALKRSADGQPELRFPNASYYVQQTEWHEAMYPNERTAATYFTDHLRLLDQSGRLELLDGDTELFPGIAVKLLGGHTPGMQAVIIEGGDRHVIYPGDLIPMHYNIKVPYVSAVDLDPIESMNQKRWLYDRMLKDGWILAFDHDIEYKFARFETDEKGNIRPLKVSQ
jgi:glyoxylase-like metal-dependent hydrolase (beta-lactamase superfamily II)